MKNIMKLKIIVASALLLFGCAAGVFAQNGGKAEPNRIKFAKRKTSAVVSGRVKGDEQAEYIFAARKGQIVSVKIVSPEWDCCASFRILDNAAPSGFLTEYPINWEYSFAAPYTGDYQIWVTYRQMENSRADAAKYKLTLSIQ